MNRLYSSLIINSSKFPKVHQVLRPRYNKEFFKRLTANVELLRKQIDKRATIVDCDYDLNNLKEDSRRLVSLKEKLDKVDSIKDDNKPNSEFLKIRVQLEELEDRIMPVAVKIPNRNSKQVPDEEVVLEEIKSDFIEKQKLSKVLSHRKLSYINNCYTKSVVGPNSHYYFNIGAKLQYGLSEFFTNELEANDFVETSGLCLAKSAIVEACNSQGSKTFAQDPARILNDDADKLTALHLVECSRESLISFVTTLGHISSNEPIRLMSSGAEYRSSSHWFDSDVKRITQCQTVHTLSLAPSIENYSMKEYFKNRDIIWAIYKKLNLPTRLVQCSLDSMYSNEYDASRIDIWLPSEQNWIQVARVSHYLDYITFRMGMKRGHLIDSTVYDGQALVAAIIENRQTSNGKFIIPSVLKRHLVDLSADESRDYFKTGEENETSNLHEASKLPLSSVGSVVLNNYEQRRYHKYAKRPRSQLFSHSRRSIASREVSTRLMVSVILIVLWTFSWKEIYRTLFPRWLQKFMWDYLYRKPYLFFSYLSAPKGCPLPKIETYDEFDRSYFEKTFEDLNEDREKEYDKNFAVRRETPRK